MLAKFQNKFFFHMKKHLLLLLITVMGFSVQQVFAQGSTTSGMRGIIRTELGEVLPGATVVALHEPTGAQFGTTTNAEGIFNIRNMNVGGPYKVTVSFVGYQNYEQTGIYLKLGQIQAIDVSLKEESTELEAITIEARRDDIFDGNRTGTQTNINEQRINTTVTASRDLADFIRLTPQAYVDNSDDDGPAISIAGQNNRYNSIFVDGAVNNDVFGLSAQGTNGGQTGVSPISIDAIEQFEILLAPYDVTQGGFTGGGVNVVTRSGTNKFQGSAYYFFRNENTAGKTPTEFDDVEREKLPEFNNDLYGFRLGGPIIKNKLFFFANVEIQRNETPSPFVESNYTGDVPLDSATTVLSDFLQNNFNYSTGGFRNNASTLESEKYLFKLDWNINQNHKLSARYSYVNAENTDGFGSGRNINFENNSEVFPSQTHSVALELKSSFGNDFANKLILGYTRVEDDRGFAGNPFPAVSIRNGNGSIFLGPEQFSTANLLEQDIFTITNNFNWFKGKHTITVGTHNEFYSIGNLFIARNFGSYEYNSLNDFFAAANAAVNGQPSPVAPRRFRRGFSLADGNDDIAGDGTNAIAEFNAFQLGFYIQDEWQISPRLKLTGGLRFDIPVITDDPAFDAAALVTTIPAIEEIYDLNGARPGEAPDPQLYFSPRFGFNWDVKGDQTTQIRGGLGVFTGRVPFVWPGGVFNNNGVNVGFVDSNQEGTTLANGNNIPFVPNPQNGLTVRDFDPTRELIPSGRLEIFQDDYRYPQVFRSSVAVDQQLPWGMVLTLEALYTKNINNVLVFNANLLPPNQRLDSPIEGGDNRPIFVYDDARIDPDYSAVHVLRNADRGYSYNLTAQVQKPFDNGLDFNVAYTYGRSFAINDGTSSQLNSIWAFNEGVNGANNLDLSESDFSLGHRILASVSYRIDYAKYLASTVSLIYTGVSGRPYSYTIDNSFSMVGDGSGDNSLLFVPRTQEDIVFVQDGDETPEQQWIRFNRFIEEDPYLSTRRGKYAERNAARSPFEHVLDLRFLQDVYIKVGENTHTLQLSLDIFNFTNLLNKDWGRRYSTGFSAEELIEFQGFVDPDNGDFTPTYQLNFPEEIQDYDDLWDRQIQDSSTYSSRWQMQVGIRYIFN